MALIKDGYFQDTYWSSRYWQEDYWPEYGTGVAPSPEEVSIWFEPKRKRRLPLDRDLLEAFQEYLELKVQQNV